MFIFGSSGNKKFMPAHKSTWEQKNGRPGVDIMWEPFTSKKCACLAWSRQNNWKRRIEAEKLLR